MEISIVITTFERPRQLEKTLASIRSQHAKAEIVVVDDGLDWETPIICKDVDVYRHLNRPRSQTYRNQAPVLNTGIKMATGDIVILQNAECEHIDPYTISKLTSFVTEKSVVFARVLALTVSGEPWMTYCGQENPRPYFFCGAIYKKWLCDLGGFDEEFTGYGWEDNDMADRLRRAGLSFSFTDVLVHHQWHESAGDMKENGGELLYRRKQTEDLVRNGGPLCLN